MTTARSPRIRGNINSPRAASPSSPLRFPWRFVPGDLATVVGWEGDKGRVLTGFLVNGWMPHYVVVDGEGKAWRVPQIAMLSITT